MGDLLYKISPSVVLGNFTMNKLPQYVKEYGNRFIVVIESSFKTNTLGEQLFKNLADHKVEHFIYDNTDEGAITKNIEYALKLSREARIDGVIAIGTTQTLLLGAVIAALFNDDRSIYDIIDANALLATKPLPLICVPSTIRVPYIFTPYTPLIDARTRQTKLLKTQKDLCRLVLWDSELATLLPDTVKFSTCIETLSLAIEASISQKTSFFSDMFAKKSVELLSYAINGSDTLQVTTPKNLLMMQSGFLSSIAVATSSVGVASLLSLVCNARYGTSMSTVSSIIFPHIVKDAMTFKAQKITELVSIFNARKALDPSMSEASNVKVGDVAAQTKMVDDFVEDIQNRLGEEDIPTKLQFLNLSVDKLALIAEDAAALDIVNTLPRSMTSDDLFEILKNAL